MGTSSWKDADPTVRAAPSWPHLNLIISQRSHLRMPSLWGLRLRDINLGDAAQLAALRAVAVLRVLSHAHSATLCTAARQSPLAMGVPRQEYWNGLPFPSPWNIPDPGIEPESLVSSALASRFFTTAPPGRRDNPYYRKRHCVPHVGWKCLQTRISVLSHQRSNVEDKLTPETHPPVSSSLRYLET